LHGAQQELDIAVEDGRINNTQWRDARRDQGILYQGALLAVAQLLPHAGQVQSPQQWADFQELTYTVAGLIQDIRVRGQILVAGWRAIPVPEIAPGVEDWDTFFARRASYERGLSAGDKKILKEELTASATPKELEWLADLEILRPYWEVGESYLDVIADPALKQAWARWLSAPVGVERDAIEMEINLKGVQGAVQLLRAELRTQNPGDPNNIDATLIRWGYVPSAKTAAGYRELAKLLKALQARPDAQPTQSAEPEPPSTERQFTPVGGRQFTPVGGLR